MKWLEVLVEKVIDEGTLIGAFSLHKELGGENPAPGGEYEVTSIALDLGTVDRGEDEAVVRAGCTALYKWPWTRPFVEWVTVDVYVHGDGGAWRRYTYLAVGDALKRCLTKGLLNHIGQWWNEEVGLKEEIKMTAREFLRRYDGDLQKGLSALDRYLQGEAMVKYAEFPDADLPGEFLDATDEPAGFDEFVADLEG